MPDIQATTKQLNDQLKRRAFTGGLEPTRRPKSGACSGTSALDQQSGYQTEYEFPNGERQ
jgi:hypothetical protein